MDGPEHGAGWAGSKEGWIGYEFIVPISAAEFERVVCHAMVGHKAVVVLKDGRRLLGEARHDGMYFEVDPNSV